MRLSLSLFALLIVLLVGACSWPFSPSLDDNGAQSGDNAVIMTAAFNGGHCLYGACNGQVTVYSDGTYEVVNGANGLRVETLPESTVADLVAQIDAADYAAIRSQPFTDTCPIAYDGQEVTYTFYTSAGTETIASCQYVIDPALPLFSLIDTIFAQYGTSPDQ
jgi:hypothetical protein